MQLTSNAFRQGERIPDRFTCQGEDISPPLQWSATPDAAGSFVLLCIDPDAPMGTWRHWAVYDIPANVTSLPEDFQVKVGETAIKLGVSSSHKAGYQGPCPPRGHGVHRYQFRLLALPAKSLSVSSRASCEDIEAEARKHMIAEATLTGTYSRA